MTDDDEEYEEKPPTVLTADGAHVRIMREKCSTCIFRSGNLMSLNPGRVRDMTDQTDAEDSNVICHKTLGADRGAFCAGSVERRPGQMAQIAQRLGRVELVDESEFVDE